MRTYKLSAVLKNSRNGRCLISILGSIVLLLGTAIIIVIIKSSKLHEEEYHDKNDHWNYDDQGGWPFVCKDGNHQSPIPLRQRSAYRHDIPAIELKRFNDLYTVQVENTGHTISIKLPETCRCEAPKLSGAGLRDNFTFDNLHFHWPSEHTIDGLVYALEGHFVFYADQFKSFDDAVKRRNTVTVMAVLYNETNYTRSDIFETISESVKHVSEKPGASVMAHKQIKFFDFLPYDHERFYKYEGSLTTPGCNENINWIVFQKHGNIQHGHLKNLTRIFTEKHKILAYNNRELQDINDRTIYIRNNDTVD